MNMIIGSINNICLQYGCSVCCNPVKINSCRLMGELNKAPFIDLGHMLISVKHPGSIRLKSYKCLNFNPQTGLCRDYFNRPDICRNTKCLAFDETSVEKQVDIIKRIKAEEFIKIPTRGD